MSELKLPMMEHLDELRKRLLAIVVVALVLFIVCFQYSDVLFRYLVLPLKSTLVISKDAPWLSFHPREGARDLVFLSPAEAFWVHMKVSMIAALVLAVPYIFFHFWRFISPGLTFKEKKLVVPFVVVTSGLFLTGAAFCFFIVLPFAMEFLLTFRTESLVPMISIEKYADFCLKFILAFGVVFELPVVIVFLTRMGLVKAETLAKHRKYAVLMAFVAGAILTPTPDAFNQTLMAVPIIVLYEVGILVSRLMDWRRKKDGDDKG